MAFPKKDLVAEGTANAKAALDILDKVRDNDTKDGGESQKESS